MPSPSAKPQLPRTPAHSSETGPSEPIPVSDIRTLEQLYRTEAPRLTVYFERRLRQRQEAGDFVQEAFARLAHFMSGQTLRQPAAYLQRIATNLLHEHARRLRMRADACAGPDVQTHAISAPADQSDRIESEQLLAIYKRALDELGPKTREAFLLHQVDDLTYREIGERLKISIATVQYHVARALTHIDASLRME